ncbi:MAG: Zn-dependent exopeptidase M28 [bacterium]|nr:Zn-dependent exopeptidase M28 [bacterium]
MRLLIMLIAIALFLSMPVVTTAFPGMGEGKMPKTEQAVDSPPDSAAMLPAAGDTARVAHIIRRLSSLEFAGRRCGSDGAAGARSFLKGQLLRAGIAPLTSDGVYEQPFTVNGMEFESLSARLLGANGVEIRIQLNLSSPPEPLELKDLRFWREDESAPVVGAGSLLVHYGPSGRGGMFLPSELLREAVRAGASGLLLIPHPEDKADIYSRYLARARMRDARLHSLAGSVGGDPTGATGIMGYILPEDVPHLFRSSGAAANGPADLITAEWTMEMPAAEKFHLSGCNLVGRIVPTREQAEGHLLVVAHYDHLGLADTGYYAGANDNASGIATLFEVAYNLMAEMSNLEVRFLLTDAEEIGLIGAQAYLRDNDAPALVVNIDSVGRAAVADFRQMRDPANYSGETVVLWRGIDDDSRLDMLSARMDSVGLAPHEGRGPMVARGGDHAIFARADVPSMFVFGGYEMNVNSEKDTPAGILPQRPLLLARALAEFILEDLQVK